MEFLDNLAANLVDFLVYLAIGLVVLIGIFKCVIPVRRSAHRLRRAIHLLETSSGEGRPVWQDVLFLGKGMQVAWRRFLVNAEQLDARGLNCNVEDYVNDDTAIYSVGHSQLAEVVPSLLTSLGILGTFIGLMRGLGGLDVSDAAKTMESIPQMIGGMTFAFMTSIAGIACSLVFNMLNRMAYGSATRAIDEFNDAFTDLVMQKPLEDNVQMICQQEDRAALLRRISADMGARVSEGILSSVEKSLTPVALSMNQFIMGQTQTQIDGLKGIVNQFVGQMNQAMGNQFAQLGQTLSQVNQAQVISFESMERTMAAADEILNGMKQVQNLTGRVMERFENYIGAMDQAQENTNAFISHGSQVLSGMISASQEQVDFIGEIKASQAELKKSMKEYAEWSSRVLNAVQDQANGALSVTGDMTLKMDEASHHLSESYSEFVDNITGGFSKALGMFDENIHSVLNVMGEKLDQYRTVSAVPEFADRYHHETEKCISSLSKLQLAITDMTKVMTECAPSQKENQ